MISVHLKYRTAPDAGRMKDFLFSTEADFASRIEHDATDWRAKKSPDAKVGYVVVIATTGRQVGQITFNNDGEILHSSQISSSGLMLNSQFHSNLDMKSIKKGVARLLDVWYRGSSEHEYNAFLRRRRGNGELARFFALQKIKKVISEFDDLGGDDK